ncbi:hypothetical protein Tco_1194491 [Tanacetum coccineum]
MPSSEPTLSYFDDFDYLKYFENEFPAIAYNDALTSKLDFSEPTVCPQHTDEFDKTSLSEYDGEEQNVIYFNDLCPFNVIYPDDLSDKDNDNDKIDIEQSSGDLSIEPLPTDLVGKKSTMLLKYFLESNVCREGQARQQASGKVRHSQLVHKSTGTSFGKNGLGAKLMDKEHGAPGAGLDAKLAESMGI